MSWAATAGAGQRKPWKTANMRNRGYDIYNVPHPFTGIHLTENGIDLLEKYVAEVRAVIGYTVPLATDHFGHIALEDCIRLGKRLEKYNLAWVEDMIPWQYTDQYVRLSQAIDIPVCTGEDIYLKEGFKPLLEARGVSVIHPDLLTSGGILENKKIGDLAQEHGVAMAVHMAESPIGCLAAVHSAWPPPRTSWPWNTTPWTSPGGTISPRACPNRWSRTALSKCRMRRAWVSNRSTTRSSPSTSIPTSPACGSQPTSGTTTGRTTGSGVNRRLNSEGKNDLARRPRLAEQVAHQAYPANPQGDHAQRVKRQSRQDEVPGPAAWLCLVGSQAGDHSQGLAGYQHSKCNSQTPGDQAALRRPPAACERAHQAAASSRIPPINATRDSSAGSR